VIGRLTDVEIPSDTGDFRLMTRRVLDILLAMPERHRFIRGMVAWIGRQAGAAAIRPQGARRRRDQISADQDGALRHRRDHRFLGGAADGPR